MQNLEPKTKERNILDIFSPYGLVGELFLRAGKLLKLGVSPEMDLEEAKKISLTNLYIAVNATCYLLYSFIYLSYVTNQLFIALIACFFMQLFSLYLIHKKLPLTAKLFTIFITCVSTASATITLGIESGFQYYFFITAIAPVLIFKSSEKLPIFISSIGIFLIYIFLDLNPEINLIEKIQLDSDVYQIIRITNIFSVFILILTFTLNIIQFLNTPEKVMMERKKLEKLLELQLNEKARIEEAWNKALNLQGEIINSIPEDIVMLDERGFLLRKNQFKEIVFKDNLIDYTDFGIGTPYIHRLEEIYNGSDLDFSEFRKKISLVLKGISKIEVLIFFYQKEKIWYEIKIIPFKGSESLGAILFHSNITEFKKATFKLKEIEEFNLRISRFYTLVMFNIDNNGNVKDYATDVKLFPTMPLEKRNVKSIHDIGFTAEVTQEIMETVTKVLSTGNSHFIRFTNSGTLTFEVRVVALDGIETLVLIKNL
ncbi:MAG: hypothetical protein SFU98_09690 [Leptospiraceae bacterium]|nr:hypothetical protein [Leptospiraceae bacterium]